MSTTRKIAHNTIAQIIGKVVSTGLGLLAIGLMTRYLGQERFGWYVTAISFLQFVGILIDFGLIPVTAQMLSQPNIDQENLLRNLLGFRLVTAVIFLAIAPLIALFFPYPPLVKITIGFSTLSFLAITMNQVLTGYYQTRLRMHVAAISEVAGRVVLIAGLWLLMEAKAAFLPIMVVIVAATILQPILMWLWADKSIRLGFVFDIPVWRKIIAKMWPIAISIMFNVVYLKGDIVLLSLFRSQNEVGLYGAAYRVLDIISQLAMLIMGVMMPLLAHAWSRQLRADFIRQYQQAFDALMMIGAPMMIGTLLTADKIMRLVGGTAFVPAGQALRLLSIAVFGVYLGAVFGHVAVAIDRQKQTVWIYASDAILTLIGYLIFIPRYGIPGAALMTIFSELYAGFFLWLIVHRQVKSSLQLKTFGKILLASAFMGMIILALKAASLFLLIPLALASYAVCLFAIGGVSKTTLQEIFSLKQVPAEPALPT